MELVVCANGDEPTIEVHTNGTPIANVRLCPSVLYSCHLLGEPWYHDELTEEQRLKAWNFIVKVAEGWAKVQGTKVMVLEAPKEKALPRVESEEGHRKELEMDQQLETTDKVKPKPKVRKKKGAPKKATKGATKKPPPASS
jgi:hypothetical protein